MHFRAGLSYFYKCYSKKSGLNIWVPIPNQWCEYISGYSAKLQQRAYHGFSTLILSNYRKDSHWEIPDFLNGVNVLGIIP